MSLKFTPQDAVEWRANWKVVLASVLGFALMNAPVHSVGIFMSALEAEFGWKRAMIASGMMFTAVSAIFLAPVVGMAVDRFGPRRIALTGSALVCITFGMFSLTTAQPWSWWLHWTLLAVCFVMIMPMVWTAAVSSLFTSSRGLALAAALSGTAVTSSVMPLYATFLIQNYGWRAAYAGLAATFAVLVLPTAFFFFTSAKDRARSRPAAAAGRKQQVVMPGMTAREGLPSSRFIRLLLASCAMVVVPSVTSTFIPIITSFGHSPLTAAGIAGLTGVAGITGRMTGGYLLDRLNGNLVAAVCMLLPIAAIGLLLTMPHSVAAISAAALIMGACVGAELDAVAYLISRHFGLRAFGVLLAVTSAAQTLVMALGPIALNSVFDVMGSYRPGLWAAIPVCAAGAVLFASLGKYRDFGEIVTPASDPAAPDPEGGPSRVAAGA